MTDSPRSASIGQLFQACDLDGSGYIDEQELSAICSDLSSDEIGNVFRQLDQDGDGRISINEFKEGFNGIQENLLRAGKEGEGNKADDSKQNDFADSKGNRNSSKKRYDLANSRESSTEWDDEEPVKKVTLRDVVGTLDDSFGSLSCQEQVCEMYQSLHAAEIPILLAQFEDIIISVIRDIRQQQAENERLERSFKREKEQHENHLRQLEEEMEGQVARVEARIRKEESEKLEGEKEELRKELETEIQELQSNLKKLQNIGEIAKTEKANDETKSRLDDLLHENRYLKSQLTDAQTSLALLRSETATLKQQFEDKCYELETEKQTMLEYIKEQDNLTRQVHLLHDANKKLHDTNDDLRSSLETHRSSSKRPHSRQPPRPLPRGRKSLKNDYVNQYLSTPANGFAPTAANMLGSNSLADELSMIDGNNRPLLPNQDSCEVDSIADDIDSGHSTMRDNHDVDSEYEPASIDDEGSIYTPRKRNRLHRGLSEFDSTTESELPESTDEHEHDEPDGGAMETEVEVDEDDIDSKTGRPCSSCSRASSHSSTRRPKRRSLPATPQAPITQEPERMYKVVLAGDAAVGKSSFIMRLCKNKFVNNLNSTLGVDFQTKTLDVDGRVIALQLWDTAGQERFRSIAKSYFRRADGVLLLYDSTYEKSFLSVRDWIETIEDGAQKKIPIMLLANKCDLREEFEKDGKRCVKTEEGQRIAKEVDGVFLETSAKEGDNIVEAVTELARMLRTNEDLEVNAVGMKLHDIALEKEEKKTACCNL